MSLLEITILSIGLAMDACCVSMTNGMVYKNLKIRDYALMPIFFGVFQGIMPLIGFYAGNIFAVYITKYSGIVIFVILGILGGKMVYDGIRNNKDEERAACLSIGILFFQAIATSIDAFAVGVGFCAINVNIIPAVSIIAITTGILTVVAILIGRKFGDIFESKAEILGGVILVVIGIKALI